MTVALNTLAPATEAETEVLGQSGASASLGAGIARPAGAGWHPGRGSLYVAAPEEMALVEVSTAGVRLSTLDTSGAGSCDPSDVAVDPASGDLFFVDRREAKVYRMTTAGTLLTSFSTSGAGATRPAGIAFDTASTRLIVSDEAEERVFAFTLAGAPIKDYTGEGPFIDLAFDANTGFLWTYEEGEDRDKIAAFSFDDVEDDLDFESELDLETVTDLWTIARSRGWRSTPPPIGSSSSDGGGC